MSQQWQTVVTMQQGLGGLWFNSSLASSVSLKSSEKQSRAACHCWNYLIATLELPWGKAMNCTHSCTWDLFPGPRSFHRHGKVVLVPQLCTSFFLNRQKKADCKIGFFHSSWADWLDLRFLGNKMIISRHNGVVPSLCMLLGFFKVFCRINLDLSCSLLTCMGKLGKVLLESPICFQEGNSGLRECRSSALLPGWQPTLLKNCCLRLFSSGCLPVPL